MQYILIISVDSDETAWFYLVTSELFRQYELGELEDFDMFAFANKYATFYNGWVEIQEHLKEVGGEIEDIIGAIAY